MNERIQELARQADTYACSMNREEDSYGRPANPKKFQQDRDSKFAELIVQECIWEVVKDDKIPHDIQVLIGQRFKQHFGVK